MRRTALFAVSSLALALAACSGKQEEGSTAPPHRRKWN